MIAIYEQKKSWGWSQQFNLALLHVLMIHHRRDYYLLMTRWIVKSNWFNVDLVHSFCLLLAKKSFFHSIELEILKNIAGRQKTFIYRQIFAKAKTVRCSFMNIDMKICLAYIHSKWWIIASHLVVCFVAKCGSANFFLFHFNLSILFWSVVLHAPIELW